MVSSSSSPAERLQWTVLAEHCGAFLAPEERDRESPPDRAAAACTEHTPVHNEQPVQASLV